MHATDTSTARETLGVNLPVKAAIFNGIFDGSNAARQPPLCATGNCTWPLFSSLAFCSQCQDVTKETVNKCGDYQESLQRRNCTWTTPSGIAIDNYLWAKSANDSGVIYDSDTIVRSSGSYGSGRLDATVAGIKTPVGALAMLNNTAGASSTPENATWAVQECALYVCINTYNVTMRSGQLSSTIVSSWTNSSGAMVLGRTAPGTNGIISSPFPWQPPAESLAPNTTNRTFSMPGQTYFFLGAYLDAFFNGSRINHETPRWVGSDGSSHDVIEALSKQPFDVAVANVAASLTDYIRSVSPATEKAVGTAFGTEAYVRVAWAWLSLPVTLVLLSFLFLVAAIVQTAGRKAPVWKSSSLAVMFQGLRELPEGSQGKVSGMERLAEGMRVRLERDGGGGWRLVRS